MCQMPGLFIGHECFLSAALSIPISKNPFVKEKQIYFWRKLKRISGDFHDSAPSVFKRLFEPDN